MNFEQKRMFYRRSLRLAINKVGVDLRMFSASKRALPEFLVAGVQKAGTTSLYATLIQHPNIYPTMDKKEIHYWDNPKNYKRGLRWYRAHFPLINDLKLASAITGEKTPNYLEKPDFIVKIKADLPSVKLIILLRNPIERTISNYFMIKKRGNEELSLMEALLNEEARLANPQEYKKFGTERAYKIRSVYAPSIKACMEHFPPGQILILDSKKFFNAPTVVLNETFDYLGLPPFQLPITNIHKNLGSYKKDEISQDVYTYLTHYFRRHNEELYSLLGFDFGWDSRL